MFLPLMLSITCFWIINALATNAFVEGAGMCTFLGEPKCVYYISNYYIQWMISNWDIVGFIVCLLMLLLGWCGTILFTKSL